MSSVGLFAFGLTGYSALISLYRKFKIAWIILPPKKDLGDSYVSVEKFAEKNNIKLFKSDKLSDVKEIIRNEVPDAVVVSSYNQILPSDILSMTKFINVHHGDLPRFRGRANINWAIILGRNEIGLTFHKIVPDLDAGDIYKQYIVKIDLKDTAMDVYNKFNKIIENDLSTVVDDMINGLKGEVQIGGSTYCCTRLPNDGYIDWTKKTIDIYNQIRALTHPFPGAFTYFENSRLYVWSSEIPEIERNYEGRIPGRVCNVIKGKGVEVLTGDSSIIIKDVTYNDRNINSSDLIKSVKKTLGIDFIYLYDSLIKKNII